MKPFPGAIPPPESKVIIHGFPGRQIVGKQTPRASASQEIENGIDNLSRAMKQGSPMECRGREKRSNAVPFRIA